MFPADTEQLARRRRSRRDWRRLLEVRASGQRARSKARGSGRRSATRCRRTSPCGRPATTADLLERHAADLPMLFITSAVAVHARGRRASSPSRSRARDRRQVPALLALRHRRGDRRRLRRALRALRGRRGRRGCCRPLTRRAATSPAAAAAGAGAAGPLPPPAPAARSACSGGSASPSSSSIRSPRRSSARRCRCTTASTVIPGLRGPRARAQRGRGVRPAQQRSTIRTSGSVHHRAGAASALVGIAYYARHIRPEERLARARPVADPRRRGRQPDRSLRRATSSTSSTCTGATGISGRSTSPTRRSRSAPSWSSSTCCW